MILYDCTTIFYGTFMYNYFIIIILYFLLLQYNFCYNVIVSKTVGNQLFYCNPLKVSKSVAISKLIIGFNVLIGQRSLINIILTG